MPMTAAHPLAVLPLRRTRLDWTCLVIGSMSPDFLYFFQVKLASRFSHTWPGVFAFCVPVTLASAWLFHRLIKRPLVQVVPAALGSRLAPFAERPWQLSWSCVVAALVGTLTHLFWDGFTHLDMWGPQHIAFLRHVVHLSAIKGGRGYIHVCRIIQHVSTVIGLTVLAIHAWRTLRRTVPRPVAPASLGMRLVWIACIALAGIACFARVYVNHDLDMGSLTVVVIDAGLFGAVLASLFTR
jgi:hypothetical protein